MQRFTMSAAASLLMLALTGLLYWAGYLALKPLVATVTVVLLLIGVFYCLVRSGLNRRFHDPSLTLPMMVSATTVVAFVMQSAGPGRKVLALAYLLVRSLSTFLPIAGTSDLGEWRLEVGAV